MILLADALSLLQKRFERSLICDLRLCSIESLNQLPDFGVGVRGSLGGVLTPAKRRREQCRDALHGDKNWVPRVAVERALGHESDPASYFPETTSRMTLMHFCKVGSFGTF